ncbi:MAG: DUF3499 family protein [Actinobacteria bacterium]|nr:DUF3499 family protein [Actinomycetota bacterium]
MGDDRLHVHRLGGGGCDARPAPSARGGGSSRPARQLGRQSPFRRVVCSSLRCMSMCSKPGCVGRGAAILAYQYEERRALLADVSDEISPHVYLLCSGCAERLRPPRGWVLDDQRNKPAVFA